MGQRPRQLLAHHLWQPRRQLPPGDLLAHDPSTLSGVDVQCRAPVTLTFFYTHALDAALGVTETVADLV